MRRMWWLCAVVLPACGPGVMAPELYDVVVDYFHPPDSCYVDMTPPNTVVTMGPSTAMQLQVWDGPEGKAYTDVPARNIDMGDAPDIQLAGVMEATHGSGGWSFLSERTAVTTIGGGTKVTDHSKVTLNFERNGTFKGLLSMTSSRVCEGPGCQNPTPSCSIDQVLVIGTRLEVMYQRPP